MQEETLNAISNVTDNYNPIRRQELDEAISSIKYLRNKFKTGKAVINNANKLANKFNDEQAEANSLFTIEVEANTHSELDLSAAWFSCGIFYDGYRVGSFRV